MSNLKKILEEKTSQESLEFFKENNIFVKEHEDIYIVYPTENVVDNDFIKECNYAFIDKATNKLIHYFTQIDEVYVNLSDVFDYAETCKKYRMILKFEGSLIKVYYHDDEWKVGTNRHPDAACSYWNSSKSFKELFYECVIANYSFVDEETMVTPEKAYENFIESLDSQYCYSFMIQHPENNLCINTNDLILHQINKVNLDTMEEELNPDLCFSSEETGKIFSRILNNETNISSNYVLYMYSENKLSRVMIESDEFLNLKETYGNCKDIRLRYIECLNNEFQLKTIRKLYPLFEEDYDDIDLSLSINLYDMYITYHRMYVKKEQVKLKGIYKDVMYKIHGQFLKTRQQIELNDIKQVLFENYKPEVLSKIINVKI